MTGKAARRYGTVLAAIRRMIHDDDGLTAEKLSRAVNQPDKARTSQYITDFRLRHPETPLFEAKFPGVRAKHWFASKHAADAFMASDPAVRVLPKESTVRVVVAKNVVEIPRHAARRVARELLEAMEC